MCPKSLGSPLHTNTCDLLRCQSCSHAQSCCTSSPPTPTLVEYRAAIIITVFNNRRAGKSYLFSSFFFPGLCFHLLDLYGIHFSSSHKQVVVSNAQLENLDGEGKANGVLMDLCPCQRDKRPTLASQDNSDSSTRAGSSKKISTQGRLTARHTTAQVNL